MSSHIQVQVVQGKNPRRFHIRFSEPFGSDFIPIGYGNSYPVVSEHMSHRISSLRVGYDIRVGYRHISFIRHNYVPLEETITTIINEVMSYMPLRTTIVYMPR